jgi:hypothetical protein
MVAKWTALALGAMNGTTDRHITRHNEIAASRVR